MKSRHRSFVVALGITAVMFSACGNSRDTPGGDTTVRPPQTGVTSTTGTGGAGGTASDPQICSCILRLLMGGDCEVCVEDSIVDNQPCDEVHDQCTTDPGCTAVVSCVAACRDEPDVAACVGSCAFPPDRDDATLLYHQRLDCFCRECNGSCNAMGDEVCPGPQGGAGGVGGAGGAGGAGGN